MSYAAVARKDFSDGIRSRMLWGLMALFLLAVGGITYLFVDSAGAAEFGTGVERKLAVGLLFVISAMPAIAFLVPLTGLVVSIKSISRERDLGSIKILLSLPHSRLEVLVGKLIGRSGLLTIAILASFVPSAILLMVQFDAFPLFELSVVTGLTILFGIAFVAVGIGASALVSTESRATLVGITIFILFYAWQAIFSYVNSRLELLSGDAAAFVYRFDLFNVFMDMLLAVFSLRYEELPNTSVVGEGQNVLSNPDQYQGLEQPFFLQHWFAFVILALWVAVPVAIGYWRFQRADL
ncbi:ABC-type transport system involved in multi-copper enzyme maturation, permease component [Halovivax ruber XH-70]|uniref:ABC-type transport system involved in multi-copper enzyme maturation, permease component n=1 Tax=Halovivax ruber (strain DSM 18193 / JCM 13892 / XH-70) TaxID=797302 RepID=L0I835_HALRX|nr:ABC transporter permease subunit [Halovivax ruber]AGB14839.1 ABC-type transport system involved in multi-copper enzyme maturation, permease component [Halovivax ruber XH-70]